MKHIKMKYGFTLIELLVVVIIIAVLSAVAVPMYKHAALKSRFSKVMPVAKSIVEAQEVYYLGKNIYAANDEKDLLDVAPSGDTTIELASRDQESEYNYVAASSTEVPGARYILYQKHSPKFANTIQCEADVNNADALWLCEKGLKGQDMSGSIRGDGYKTFLLAGNIGTNDTFASDSDEQSGEEDDTGGEGGNNSSVADPEPAYTMCPTGQCKKDGVCVPCDYAGDSMCSGKGINCNDSTFGDNSGCTKGALCKRSTFSGMASCSGGTTNCDESTFTEQSICQGTAGATPHCSGATFSDESSCDGGACFSSPATTGITMFTDNATCKGIGECGSAIFSGNSVCTSTLIGYNIKGCSSNTYSNYISTFKENAVCAGAGCNTATYQGKACCAVAECSGYHIPKCTQSVANGETVYTRTNTYWDED